MRCLATLVLALFITSHGISQDKNAVPPRFQSFAKDGSLRLVSVLGSPEMHPAVNATTAFTPDGKRAVYVEDLTTGMGDKAIYRSRVLVWNVESKSWPREFDIAGKSVTAIALSGNGDKILLAGETLPEKAKSVQTYLGLWDLESGKELRSFLTDERLILSVALSADEKTALAGTTEDLKLWDLAKGKATLTYDRNNKFGVTALAFMPGGKQFLAGYHGGDTRLHDVGKSEPIRTFKTKGDHQFIWHLAVSKDGKRFAAGDLQSSVTLWDVGGNELGSLRFEKRTIEEVVTAVAIADDGKTVISTWSKAAPEADEFHSAKIVAWDGETNKTLWSHVTPYRGRLPVHLQGDLLQVGGGPNRFDVWSIKSGKLEQSWGGHKGPVSAVAVLASGETISGGIDGTLLTWSKGTFTSRERVHSGTITALAISRDRREWLSAGSDLTIRVWPLRPDRKREFLKAHGGPITSLAFGGGNLVYSSSGDRTVKSWHLTKGMEVASFAGHSEGVNAVAIAPDDRWLASGSDDTTIKIWPVKDGKLDPDREPITLEKHKKAITCLAFTPDGKRLLSGSQDQSLIVWDPATGKVERTISGHKNWINSILQLDEKTVVTSSDDLSVCVWDLTNGKELARVDFGILGDCPRCLAQVGPDRILVGTSSWLIYEFQFVADAKTKSGNKSSNK